MASTAKTFFDPNGARRDTVYGNNDPQTPPIRDGLPFSVDTVVIGAGLTGLAAALELAEAGQNVVVLDARKVGDGPSGLSGGQLWHGVDGALSELSDPEKSGDRLAGAAIRAMQLVDEGLAKVVARAKSAPGECDYSGAGTLVASLTDEQTTWVKEEAGFLRDKGFHYATHVDHAGLKTYLGTDVYGEGMLLQGGAGHLNSFKFVKHMAHLAREAGAKLLEHNPVTGIGRHGDGYVVTTELGYIDTKNVVLATGADFMAKRPDGVTLDVVPRMQMACIPTIVVTEPISEEVANKIIPGADKGVAFCDGNSVDMSYGKIFRDQDNKLRLMFGGAGLVAEAHARRRGIRRRDESQRVNHGVAKEAAIVKKAMYRIFPILKKEGIKIDRAWGAKDDFTTTSLPYILKPLEGFYTAAGYSGQGMVNTTTYGSAMAQAVLGKPEAFDVLSALNPEPYNDNIKQAYAKVVAESLATMKAEAKEGRAFRRGQLKQLNAG